MAAPWRAMRQMSLRFTIPAGDSDAKPLNLVPELGLLSKTNMSLILQVVLSQPQPQPQPHLESLNHLSPTHPHPNCLCLSEDILGLIFILFSNKTHLLLSTHLRFALDIYSEYHI
jgi:hypothetical protein